VVEVLVVLAILGVLVTAAVFQVQSTIRAASANTAASTTLNQMQRARQRAIDDRAIYRLTFVKTTSGNPPITVSSILLEQVQVNPGAANTYTLVSSIALPTDTQFANLGGIPTSAAGTPDGFGDGSQAINFAVNAGGDPTMIYFQPDGRALTQTGEVANGVVYIARPGDLLSSRAISMYGGTGRCKSWRLVSLSDGSTAWAT